MKYLFIVFSFHLCVNVQGQIGLLRYDDNFSALKNDSLKKGFEKLKYIRIGRQSFVSMGGELRQHAQFFNNQNFGDVPPGFKSDVRQLWHRIMIHANIELAKRTRIFLQLNNTVRFFNPNPLIPEIEENQLSLHQYFIDFNVTKNWLLRLGRQELNYGNARVIGVREGPNTRLTFDAIKLAYRLQRHKLEIIAATPVIARQYVFDDTSFADGLFGLYGLAFIKPKKIFIEYYMLYFQTGRRQYQYVSGIDKRHVFGIRLYSKNEKINYDFETSYQTGSFNKQDVRATNLRAEINYLLSKSHYVIIGAYAEHITGDKDYFDKNLNTYNTIFSKPLFELAAPIGSSNIQSINSYIQISPLKKLTASGNIYFIRRQSIQDGLYAPDGTQLRPGIINSGVESSRPIGTQFLVGISYVMDKYLAFVIDGIYFKNGAFLKQTGRGENLTYLSFKGTLKF